MRRQRRLIKALRQVDRPDGAKHRRDDRELVAERVKRLRSSMSGDVGGRQRSLIKLALKLQKGLQISRAQYAHDQTGVRSFGERDQVRKRQTRALTKLRT